MSLQRIDKRKNNQLREINITPNYSAHAEGSVLIKFGNTHVLCNASVENAPPRWMQTNERLPREAQRGKQSG